MTVQNTKIVSGPYIGNDVSVSFNYDWRIEDKSEITVIQTNDTGVETILVVDTDYTVAGISDDGGGQITLTAGALPTGYTLYLRSDFASTQLTAFSSQGSFLPENHEAAMDKLTRLIQQLDDYAERGIRIPLNEDIGTFDPELASADVRANQAIVFDANGDLDYSLITSVQTVGIRKGYEVATAGQVAFTTAPYVLGSHNLNVYINGVRQASNAYVETNTTTFTLVSGVDAGDLVEYNINVYPELAGTQDASAITFTQLGTGAIARTANDKFHDFISIKDFGATGDGVTDDTAAIQAAIDSVKNGTSDAIGGRSIYIPAGEYYISTKIVLPVWSHVTIYGEGPNSSVLVWNGGATPALSLEGTASGENRQFAMRNFSIRNNATGTIGFEGNFVAYSGTIENMRIDHFSDSNYWIENFENGVMINCLSEMGRVGLAGSLTNNGFWFENANGIVLIGCQTHNYGNATGNNASGLARASFTGSVGFFFNNCDSVTTLNIVPEGGTTDIDVGVWLEETIDRVTPNGCVTLHGYWERSALAVKLRGFDSDTPLRHIQIGGKIGNCIKAVQAENYVDNVAFPNGGMRLSGAGGTKTITGATQANPVVLTSVGHGFVNGELIGVKSVVGMVELNDRTYVVAGKTDDTFQLSGIDGTGYTAYSSAGTISPPILAFDDTCDNIDIGNNTYGANITIANKSTFPPIKPSSWVYHNTPISVYTVNALVANTSLFTHTVQELSGDYRTPKAVLLNLTLKSNTTGSSGRIVIRVLPTGGSTNEQHNFYTNFNSIGAGDTSNSRIVIPCNSEGAVSYQVFVTGSVSWDIDVDIEEIGVML